MRHFFSTRIRVVLILALLLTGILAVVSGLTGQNIPGMIVQTVLTPLRSGANALTNQAEQMYNYMFRYESLQAENEALRSQIAEMQESNRLADSISRENDRLRQLLKLKEANPDYELVDGYVISRSSTDWNSSFTVDRGSLHGIEAGMVAITANGEVVGLVTEAGSNYCTVKTVLDSSLEISANIASSGYSGMVQGAYTSDLRHHLRMNYLPSSAVIRNRDQVVTAGSTVYPRNLILGYVVDVGLGSTGVAKYAIIEPAADIENLEQVFILTHYDQE
ncbi:MAG: rod shape-determining protein MreC [Oscillospiraceae bacterium]|nr:rod shape-determining protein MreC [Oscillospiraceae bacterium]